MPQCLGQVVKKFFLMPDALVEGQKIYFRMPACLQKFFSKSSILFRKKFIFHPLRDSRGNIVQFRLWTKRNDKNERKRNVSCNCRTSFCLIASFNASTRERSAPTSRFRTEIVVRACSSEAFVLCNSSPSWASTTTDCAARDLKYQCICVCVFFTHWELD